MSGNALSRRSLQRRAQGIIRSRLLQPIVSARPSLVVLAAPSGFGKTVLAAQLAVSPEFPEAVWVDAAGERGSFRETLERLASQLRTRVAQDGAPTTIEGLADSCATELADRPDGHCVLIVVDNAGWASNADDVDVLLQAVSEAPRGSVLVLTTRSGEATCRGGWVADAVDLGMTDAELRELSESLTGRSISDMDLCRLTEMSDRHPALASLLVSRWAMDGADAPASGSRGVATQLIRSLVSEQLSPDERVVLDYAAALGSGPAERLVTCSGCGNAEALLRRASSALPLVTTSGSGKRTTFAVHQMVAEALSSADTLVREHPEGFARVVRTMLGSEDCVGAVDLASSHESEELTVECLTVGGARLLAAGHSREVRAALDSLPAIVVASDPRLLLLSAECAWENWEGAEARSGAQLALRSAEAMEDFPTVVRSRLFLARIRALTMDHAGVIGDVEPLLASDAVCLDSDAASDAIVSLLLAYTFLGDRDGLSRIAEPMRRLAASSDLRVSSSVRLALVRGLSAGLLDGDWSVALEYFSAARSDSGFDTSYSTVVLSDMLVAMLNLGLFTEAEAEICRLRTTIGLDGSTTVSLRSLATFIDRVAGRDVDLKLSVEMAADEDARNHDQLSLAFTFAYSSMFALALREAEWGMSIADRAVRSAMATGSPVLVWMAELAQAAASAFSGDIERGRGIASRVLAEVEPLGAQGHIVQARLLLAYGALTDDDLSQAVHHLYCVSDYIREKSPVLIVASYLRAFPSLLGPLALAMGVEHIPARVLGLLRDPYAGEALAEAAAVLTPDELKRLQGRIRLEEGKWAQHERTEDLSEAVCRVRVLGGLEVVAPHGKVGDRDWTKRKARLLFAMLVARAGTDVPRGEITEYLWPEMDEERALNNFYVVWSAMKRALAPNSIREVPCPFVEHIHSVCRIVPGRVVTDLEEFEEHMADARRARERSDPDAELAAIRAAEEVYRGDVLPGDIYDDWFASIRMRVRHAFDDAMLRASQILDDRGEPHAGLSMLRRPMERDTLREDFYQAALRLQISSGQRSAAIDTYMSCRSHLVEELGIDPSRETTALYEQVLGMEE